MNADDLTDPNRINVPHADTVISEARALARDLIEYCSLCSIMKENDDFSQALKDLLADAERMAKPVADALTKCIHKKLSKESVADLNASSRNGNNGKMHNLEIWLDKIKSQLIQNKEEGGFLHEATVNLKKEETLFYVKLSNYQGYWHHGVKPLGTTNPYLVTM